LPVSKSPTKLGAAAAAAGGSAAARGSLCGPSHPAADPTTKDSIAATTNPRPHESQLNLIALSN